MTMKRNEKRGHEMVLKGQAPAPEFQAPKLRAAARAERGTTQMSPAEYAVHRMHRGPAGRPASATRAENATTKIQAQRVTTRK